MIAALYKTKKALKDAVGQPLQYEETSTSGKEYQADGTFPVVGPSAYERKWYAQVTMKAGIVEKVK